jgi:putative spermidine/putrescine transport system ATP-binding protein
MLAENPLHAAETEAPDASIDAHLRLDHLQKRFGDFQAVEDLTVSVRRGELIALLGPSGCGKTTTLRMIAGLASVTAGRILVDGREVQTLPAHARDMGLVFQSYALFPHMTVERNVAFGLEMRKISRSEIAGRVAKALELVQLQRLAQRRPRELSGGQQQRVALARALVIEPSILLLDEPLSNLDAKLRDRMRVEIRDIQQRLGITSVFVTHDQVEALSMCDRIAVMDRGRLAQIGTPRDIYERPATPFVAEFVGRINKLPGRMTAKDTITVGGRQFGTAVNGASDGDVTAMIRPHRIEIVPRGVSADTRNAAEGTITRATYVGDILEYTVALADGVALSVETATGGNRRNYQPGDEVELRWAHADTIVFGADV